MLLEILLTRGLVMVVMIMLLEFFQKKFILSFYLSFFLFFFFGWLPRLFWVLLPLFLNTLRFWVPCFFFFFWGGGLLLLHIMLLNLHSILFKLFCLYLVLHILFFLSQRFYLVVLTLTLRFSLRDLRL